jgi:hypothetical protein
MSLIHSEINALKLPEGYVNRAKPTLPREPTIEYTRALDFIKTIMRDFVEQREGRNRDRIMEDIGINRFKSDLLADNLFVIDYHFLIMKFRLNVGGSPAKELKINALINDVLLPSYKAVRCIQNTSIIATYALLNIRRLLGDTNPKPVSSVLDIIIDEDLIEKIASEDVEETFNEHWETDESAKKIPETIAITPLMVLEYYVHKLNKLLVKLHYYKISINKTIIASINQSFTFLNKLLKEIYNYDPKWMILIKDIKKTRSFTPKKTKRNSKRSFKRATKSI